MCNISLTVQTVQKGGAEISDGNSWHHRKNTIFNINYSFNEKSEQIAHRPAAAAAAYKVRLSADAVQKSIHIFNYDVLSEIFFFCLHILNIMLSRLT